MCLKFFFKAEVYLEILQEMIMVKVHWWDETVMSQTMSKGRKAGGVGTYCVMGL